jgi:hypothetical protein
VAEDSTLTSAGYMLTELSTGTTYHWRLRAHLADGWSAWSAANSFTTTSALSVGSVTSASLSLQSEVHPNPARGNVAIRFTLPASAPVTVTIHDARGSAIATLLDGTVAAGNHTVIWQPDGVASGLYFYRIQAGGESGSGEISIVSE